MQNLWNKFLEIHFCKDNRSCALFCDIGTPLQMFSSDLSKFSKDYLPDRFRISMVLIDFRISTYGYNRDVFKTLPNIWNITFCKTILHVWQGSKYTYDDIKKFWKWTKDYNFYKERNWTKCLPDLLQKHVCIIYI